MPSHHTTGDVNNCGEPPIRKAGTFLITERWWRDRYDEIASRGYDLRPRYHHHWQPPWLKSGKKFSAVDDGQRTVVRASLHILRP
jgi:hypothetical protein